MGRLLENIKVTPCFCHKEREELKQDPMKRPFLRDLAQCEMKSQYYKVNYFLLSF